MNLFQRIIYQLFFKKRGKGFYYINGPETLPAPLTAEQEQEVIQGLPAPWAKDMLIEHNLRLVAFIAKRYEATGVGIEDLISIGTPGLIKAINTFCPEKSIKLATYASRCIENEILMYLRKNNNQKCEISLDEPLSSDWDGNELLLSDVLSSDEESVEEAMEKQQEEKAVRSAVALLEPRERELIELRYGIGGKEEKTQKEVADMLGISQSYISRLEKRILARLKEVLS